MAGSNPEAAGNSPKSPVANPNPKQAWKQRSQVNVAPAAVSAVLPAIEVGGGPESWPALSESTAKAGLKPSPKASDGSSGSSPSPPPVVVAQQQMVSSPSKSGNPTTPNFTSAPNQPQNHPRPKPLKSALPHSSPFPSPVPLHSSDPSSKDNTNNNSNNNNARRGGYNGPNKWRGNNNNNNNSSGGGRRNNNSEYYEGFYQKGASGQNQPRGGGGGMRPHFVRSPQNPIPGPGAPAQHAPFLAPPQPQPSRPQFPAPFPEMGGPVYYFTGPPMEAMRGWAPFVTSPINSPPVIFPRQLDPQRFQLLMQIDFYFSPENLCKDIYLRRNMDEQGWVPVSLIAGFNKVKQMTNNVPFILETLQLSAVVEVQGDKIRRRNDWQQWLLSPEQKSTFSAPQNPSLTARFQNFNLDPNSNNASPSLSRSSTSGDLTENMQMVHGGPGPVIGSMDSAGRVLLRSDTL